MILTHLIFLNFFRGAGTSTASSTTPTAVFSVDYAADFYMKRAADFVVKVAPDFILDENQ